MVEFENAPFDAGIFHSKAGPGRRIIGFAPKQPFFSLLIEYKNRIGVHKSLLNVILLDPIPDAQAEALKLFLPEMQSEVEVTPRSGF